MRLEKAIFHNIGPFKHAEIDFEALGDDAKLVALCGINGAGKTFSLQAAIAGAAYRKMPTQGTLVGRATARDSFVESHLTNGQRWIVRHDLDAVSRKGEATVRDAAGEPAYKGTSVKLFDAWSAKHFTAQDVLFATSFAVQKSGGFVDLGSADRISVILQVVGVSRIERMAEGARKEACSARLTFEKIEARLSDERARCGDVEALEAALVDALAVADAWDSQVKMARSTLESARAEAMHLAELAREAESARALRAELDVAIVVAREKVAELSKRLAACRAKVAESDKIRGAGIRIAEVDAELARLATQTAAQRGELGKLESELAAARESLATARREKRDAQERVARLSERLADEGKVHESVEALPGSRIAVDGLRSSVAELELALQDLRDQRTAGDGERIGTLRQGLSDVSSAETVDARALAMIADNVLDADDESVRLATELPGRVAAQAQSVIERKAALGAMEQSLARHERLAARAPEFASIRVELTDANAAIVGAEQREAAADERVTAATAACEPLRAAVTPLHVKADALRAERVQLEPVTAGAELLSKAEALLPERETQLAAAQSELAGLEAKNSATPEPAIPPPAPDVAAFSKALADDELTARAKHAAAAVAEQKLTAAQQGLARLCELQTEHDAAAAELADWNRLASDFGRDGLQSAEVDSAGPELTALTNDLLHSCHGAQFTVSIETSRLSSDGKGEVEECRVQVIDSVAGREGEAREFSGGQSVIIGEAISLALTMLACNRAGLKGITLVRDESGAALDPVAGRAYVKMLRRAADFVSASRVLLVVHNQELAEMCDARIMIKDGTITYQ